MALLRNVPFASILACMVISVISMVFRGRVAKVLSYLLSTVLLAASIALSWYFLQGNDAFVFTMGHFGDPWGNELRAGLLESVMASAMCLIVLAALAGGSYMIRSEIPDGKKNLFYIMADLMLAAVMALIYTNDLFTSYVFIEIATISAGGLTMSRQNGRALASSARYMIMNLVGSGLCLMGITILYGTTGHLLMGSLQSAVHSLFENGSYHLPLMASLILLTVGLSIKSGLFPFHEWLPDTYSYGVTAGSALLSSVISKGYIFLLIKLYTRVFGLDLVRDSHICILLFAFGTMGLIIGSLRATQATDIRRMVSYSSIAQIGYIYIALGLGTQEGVIAAVFHMLVHAFGKSMLFLSSGALIQASGGASDFVSLRGSARRDIPAGVAFTVGAMSLTGVPLLGGFVSKIYIAQAAIARGGLYAVIVLLGLAASTFLNTLYFLRTVITIYRSDTDAEAAAHAGLVNSLFLCAMVILNFALGIASRPLYNALLSGLNMFI